MLSIVEIYLNEELVSNLLKLFNIRSFGDKADKFNATINAAKNGLLNLEETNVIVNKEKEFKDLAKNEGLLTILHKLFTEFQIVNIIKQYELNFRLIKNTYKDSIDSLTPMEVDTEIIPINTNTNNNTNTNTNTSTFNFNRNISRSKTDNTNISTTNTVSNPHEKMEKKIINEYYALKKLGNGSFGDVYLAYDKINDREVAVKIIKKHIGGKEVEEFKKLQLLRDECKKYYICVHEFVDTPKYLYIIMEYLEEYKPMNQYITTMHKSLIAKDSNIKLIENVFQNLNKALCGMHRKGIAHNDLKPENIMMNPKNGDIKFIDFGLSCLGVECTINSPREFGGTPEYMDPYQYQAVTTGKQILPETRSKADIWAVGIIIYYIASNRLPFYNFANGTFYLEHYKYETDARAPLVEQALSVLSNPPDLEILLNENPDLRKLNCRFIEQENPRMRK